MTRGTQRIATLTQALSSIVRTPTTAAGLRTQSSASSKYVLLLYFRAILSALRHQRAPASKAPKAIAIGIRVGIDWV